MITNNSVQFYLCSIDPTCVYTEIILSFPVTMLGRRSINLLSDTANRKILQVSRQHAQVRMKRDNSLLLVAKGTNTMTITKPDGEVQNLNTNESAQLELGSTIHMLRHNFGFVLKCRPTNLFTISASQIPAPPLPISPPTRTMKRKLLGETSQEEGQEIVKRTKRPEIQ
ncbi:hypothetical protein PROFUN_05460 [Planoprotostelium fungivorum]|uniref:FHA domain-containing protein n=1 Tax=Planoprotostelium fungivorum TaxID=1890364 RepID=A0A2P6NQU0_9EUKA|nr:hypothetical protein PROFUN_05460 [Planoprotostelium fungivorum]